MLRMMFAKVVLMCSVLSQLRPGSAAAAALGANSCQRSMASKRLVKLTLKPNTEVVDLVAWISSVTCKQFVLPGNLPTTGKTVTIISPQVITINDAYDLFLTALDSVSLTAYPSNGFLRIVEVSKVKTSPIPVVVTDALTSQNSPAIETDLAAPESSVPSQEPPR
jgi:hypothetical protein